MTGMGPYKYEPESTCYAMAYKVLPRYAVDDRDSLLKTLSAGRAGAVSFYAQTCEYREMAPDPVVADQLSLHAGTLDARHDFYVIQFPVPRPVNYIDLPYKDVVEAMTRVVLAPYFSAFVDDREAKATHYFTLGQSPDGGTTLRAVTPDSNANMGPGSAPAFELFLQLLRETVAEGFRSDAVTGDRPNPFGSAGGEPQAKRWWQIWK